MIILLVIQRENTLLPNILRGIIYFLASYDRTLHLQYIVFAIFCKNVPITKQTSLVYNLFLLTAFTSAFLP